MNRFGGRMLSGPSNERNVMRAVRLVALAGFLIMPCSVIAAADSDYPRVMVSAGAEYTTGTYGGDEDIEDIYAPFSSTLDLQRWSFRLTIPYVRVRAPEGTTIIGPGGEPIPGTGDIVTNDGLGDIIASATMYDVIYSRRLNFAMDLTGKVKFGTADADLGLGTGKADYSVRADFLKFWDEFTLIGSLGYKFRGDTGTTDFDNVLTASVGGTYRFTPKVRGGLFFDYRESSISGNDSIQELSAFISRPVSEHWRLQAYVITGLTDNSLDWGAGFRVKRALYDRRDR